MLRTELIVDEQDEAGNLTTTYVESSTDEAGKHSRLDTIVGAQRPSPKPYRTPL